MLLSSTRFEVILHFIVKERLAQNRHDIWSLSDSKGTWIHNHLVRKRTLNHLAKFG